MSAIPSSTAAKPFWDELVLQFYRNLRPPKQLPDGFAWLHPQKQADVRNIMKLFYSKYYHDQNQRCLLLGINPGRHGAGITGINFTAPRQLTQNCKIDHSFGNGSELSAEFIYQMIEAGGGADWFYKRFYIGSVCPLGLTKDDKNINYYDDRELSSLISPFIEKCVDRQCGLPVSPNTVICIGGEKNFKYLQALNQRARWFENLVPLPHPRFIMQYRRKEIGKFIDLYLNTLNNCQPTL